MTLRLPELLERLAEVDECAEIEAKRCELELGKSALETISAFSNEPGMGGGYLLCGVEDPVANDSVVVHGVADPKKLEQEIATVCASAFNRAVRPRISVERHGGNAVVIAFIPEASPHEKPVFIASRGLQHGAFRRVGSSDQRCTEDDLRVLFRTGDATAYEDTILSDAEEHELDEAVITAYRRQLLDENPTSELVDATLLELVQSVGGARRVDGRSIPTVAGVLLFGSRLLLRRLFPQLRVDYIRVPGRQWVPDPDQRYDSIEIRDPLLQTFRRAYSAIVDDLPRSFVLEPGSPVRQDRTLIPESVIREALVNALTHRDYRIASAIQVIRYADRIEIRNPGRSLVSSEQFGQPGSFPRNPHLADVFREMRLAENKGTGIEAMRRAMKHADLAPPLFDSSGRADLFVTILWFHSLLDDAERAWLDGIAPDLTVPQRQALVIAYRAGVVTNATLRGITGLDPIQARRELHGLRSRGLLQVQGERRGTYYVLSVDGPNGGEPNQGDSDTDRGELASDRGELAGDNRSDRGELAADRGELASDRGESGDVALPRELLDLISKLGRRPRQGVIREAIRRLCAWKSYRPAELASILNMRPDKLSERHLSPMLALGLLARVHPETPKHPEQAYRATQIDLVPIDDDDPGSEP